jgi:hypothetical protein
MYYYQTTAIPEFYPITYELVMQSAEQAGVDIDVDVWFEPFTPSGRPIASPIVALLLARRPGILPTVVRGDVDRGVAAMMLEISQYRIDGFQDALARRPRWHELGERSPYDLGYFEGRTFLDVFSHGKGVT